MEGRERKKKKGRGREGKNGKENDRVVDFASACNHS